MKEEQNTPEKAIEALRNERIPQGPPQELVDATVTKLSEFQEQSEAASSGGVIGFVDRIKSLKGVARFAAAAVLLLVVGYAVGRGFRRLHLPILKSFRPPWSRPSAAM